MTGQSSQTGEVSVYIYTYRWNSNHIQCSPLNSNSRGPTKSVLIMKCSNYKFALNIKCKYNGLSGDHNRLSELTGFLN